jgi:hypothetical protein
MHYKTAWYCLPCHRIVRLISTTLWWIGLGTQVQFPSLFFISILIQNAGVQIYFWKIWRPLSRLGPVRSTSLLEHIKNYFAYPFPHLMPISTYFWKTIQILKKCSLCGPVLTRRCSSTHTLHCRTAIHLKLMHSPTTV